MNKIKRTVLISILLTFSAGLFAQEQNFIPNFIPPSPTAYELGKYGQIPIGLFTGTPNLSVPLYEYKTKNLSVPISLSYNSNGIKVDQVESNVGLGWSLNAGGVVTRIVRGLPDNKNLTFYPEGELTNLLSPMTIEYLFALGQGGHDSEPDLFMFNFQGHSGKFVYDWNKRIIPIPYQDIQIEPYVEESKKGYLITTSDGIKYYFLDVERTTNYTEGVFHGEYDNRNEETAWYLSRIVHPSGDEVYFTYEGQSYSYTTSKSETLTVEDPNSHDCQGNRGSAQYETFINSSSISGKKLTGISSNNPYTGSIAFNSGYTNPVIDGNNLISSISVNNKDLREIERFDFSYLYTQFNKRLFLQKISFKDPSKSYQFEYDDPQGLPERLSMSQDHWGYYNGQNYNTHMVPNITDNADFMYFEGLANKEPYGAFSVKGLLKKITYPTKGYTQLSYEPNSYTGSRIIPGPLAWVALQTSNNEPHGTSTVSDNITTRSNQRITISVGVSYNSDACGEEHTHTPTVDLTILDNQASQPVELKIVTAEGQEIGRSTTFTDTDAGPACFAYLGDSNYTITLNVGQCTNGSVSFSYSNTAPQTVPDVIETGGQRVKSVTIYDPVQGKSNVTRYYYGSMNNLHQPDADIGAKPYYISNKIAGGTPTCTSSRFYKVLSSSSLIPLFNTGNSNIYYRYVTLSQGGDGFQNGGEEHEFTINRDIMGNAILQSNNIYGAPWTNSGWDNGLEKRVRLFKSNGNNFTVVQETTNSYTDDPRNYSKVTGYSVRKNYELYGTPTSNTYTCTEADTKKVFKEYNCTATHVHHWGVRNGATKCIALGAQNTYSLTYHNCYGKPAGTQIVWSRALENLDIMVYENQSHWSYLDYSETKQYYGNPQKSMTSTTHYHYDNPAHAQLSSTETTNSQNEKVLTRTYYPDDNLVNLGFSAEQDQLIKKLGGGEGGLHRTSEPVQTEQLVNDQRVSTKRTLYKNWGQENPLIFPEIIEASSGSSSLEPHARYKRYDEKGNPLEVSKENDVTTSYYWGYNGLYPVAKFENMGYSAIEDVANGLKVELDKLDDYSVLTDPAVRSQLKALNDLIRTKIQAGVLLTTYTFDPLVGITSSTDTNGLTTYYEYDGFGRLIRIKDDKGNILKLYEYNYATNP